MFSISPSVLGTYFALNKCNKYIAYHSLGIENAMWARRDDGSLLPLEDIPAREMETANHKESSEFIRGKFLWKLKDACDDEKGVDRKEWRVIETSQEEEEEEENGILSECFNGNPPSTPVSIKDSISHKTFILDSGSVPQSSRAYGTYITSRVGDDTAVIVSKMPIPMSHVQDRHIRTGIAWEQYLVEQLLHLSKETSGKWTLEMGDVDGPSGENRISEEMTLSLLAKPIEPGHTTVLYQPSLVTGPRFYEMYSLTESAMETSASQSLPVKVSRCYPDFMLLEGLDNGKTLVTIVDAKGSQKVSSSHKVQIAFYSLILRSILEEHGLEERVSISDRGCVWLRPDDFEVTLGEGFDAGHRCSGTDSQMSAEKRLERLREALRPFNLEAPATLVRGVLQGLFKRLSAVGKTCDIEDLTQFGDHCALCTYGPICGKALESRHSLSVYREISPSDARLAATEEDLRHALESGPDPEVEVRLRRVAAVLDAAAEGVPVLRGAGTDTFPLEEDVSVYLAIAVDKPSRKVCCWAVKALFHNDKSAAVVSKLRDTGTFTVETTNANNDTNNSKSCEVQAFGTSSENTTPWGPAVDSEGLCRDLVLCLHTLFDAIAAHNAALEKELWKAKVVKETYDHSKMLGATLVVASTAQADLLRSILWAGLRSGTSKAAEDLLWAMFGGDGSLICAPTVRSYIDYRRPYLVRLAPEMARLFALGARVLDTSDTLGAWARAFGVLPGECPGPQVGTEAIVESWSSEESWTPEKQRAALAKTISAMEGIVAAARASIKTSPDVSARVPQRAVRFGWMPRVGGKAEDESAQSDTHPQEEFSQHRRECVFMNQYEAYTDYADKYSIRALRSIRDHLRYGSMYLLTLYDGPDESVTGNGKPRKKPKNPTLFYVSPAAQRGLETKRDRSFLWWLIPYGTPSEDAEASILRSLEEFREYYFNFRSEKTGFIVVPTFSRVLIDPTTPFTYDASDPNSDPRPVLHLSYYTKGKEFDTTCSQYLLAPSPFDVNAPRMGRALCSWAAFSDLDGRASFEEIVEHPVRWATAPFETDASAALRERALAILAEGDFQLTPSQHAAVERVLNTHLQLLWGPPGTGKTQVLGVLVTVLARAAAELHQPLRILVTALSHSNIDGLLSRIRAVRDAHANPGASPVPAVGRFDEKTKVLCEWTPEVCAAAATAVAPAPAPKPVSRTVRLQKKINWIEENPICVIGGTVWQFMSELLSPEDFCPLGAPFDMLLWDDASQSKTEDLAVYGPLLSRSSGRLVLAGDPLQLPPIVRGAYPPPPTSGLFRRAGTELSEPAVPLVTRSVYECIEGSAAGDAGLLRSPLLENWRMNNEISSFLQSTLYSAIDYRAAKADDERSRIPAPDLDAVDTRIAPVLLAPEKSVCVVCVSRGEEEKIGSSRGTAADMHPEAPLVALLVRALCAALHADPQDPDVWERLLFLICPHHSQIAAVSRALGEPAARPLTVERAQGLERDVVIADYALFNTDVIRGELEFLFNANRMNVCLSRARKKCVFVVSDVMLGNAAGFDILESNRTEQGYLFLHRIVEHAKDHGAFVNVRLGSNGEIEFLD